MIRVLKYFKKEENIYDAQHLEYCWDKKKNYVVTLKNIYFDISRDEDVLIDENPAKREMSIEKKKKRVTIITSKRYVVK